MAHDFGWPPAGMGFDGKLLLTVGDSPKEAPWEPSAPDGTSTLWRYMSFAKFCSLLERKELFFSLVGDMEDRYEGFICPPTPREQGGRIGQAENYGYELLRVLARNALISCWTESAHESYLMWEAYAGSEGVAIRTTFQRLQDSIRSVGELPVTFGRVEYVDYQQKEFSRFGFAPLFRKRIEYRGEDEVRAVLPGPSFEGLNEGRHLEVPDVPLDPDVAEQRGRYVPVNLEILLEEIVLPPNAAPWFAQVVESVIHSPTVGAPVTRSLIESMPIYSNN